MTTSLIVVDRLFEYVSKNHPKVFNEILLLIRPYKLNSIKHILYKHLKRKSLEHIKTHAVAGFLLEFCRVLHERLPEAGRALGILKVSRITSKLTQNILDSKHLQNVQRQQQQSSSSSSFFFSSSSSLSSSVGGNGYHLYKQVHVFTELQQIFELSQNGHRYFQIFTRCSVRKLLRRLGNAAEFLTDTLGRKRDGKRSYLYTNRFIVINAFVEDVNRVLYRRRESLPYLFRRVPNILAMTDIKYVFQKCGICTFFFNYLRVVELQYFKHSPPTGREEMDIVSLMKYQCSTGEPLPFTRNGMKRNPNRTPLQKLCFEAAKQSSYDEALQHKWFPVRDSTSKMFFGQPFGEGTNYDFALILED